MKCISLLFLNETKPHNKRKNDFSGLFIEECFKTIVNDPYVRNRFLSVIFSDSPSKEDIYFRQSILKDFIASPHFFKTLNNDFLLLKKFIVTNNEEKKNCYHFLYNSSSDNKFSSNTSVLQIASFECKRLISIIRKISHTFEYFKFNSAGLIRLSERIKDIINIFNDFSLDILLERFINYYPEEKSSSCFIELNDFGRIGEFTFLRIEESLKTKKHQRFISFNNINTDNQITTHNKLDLDELFAKEILNLISAIFSLTDSIKNEFDEIIDDLLFYDAGLSLYSYTIEKNIPYCFPEIKDSLSIDIEKLYDLPLVMQKDTIIPHSLSISSLNSGVIIFGPNGSGKTVLCRSVIYTFLFAFSGLPVLSKRAILPYFEHVAFLAASSEDNMNDMGRFENEAKKVSDLLDNLCSHTIIFFNELFQSTPERDGSMALNDILNFFEKKETFWMIVTHLTSLINLNKNNKKIKMITISENHHSYEI